MSVLSFLWALVEGITGILWKRAKSRPIEVLLVVIAILRSFGTTVRTGWHGVLFRFGRARVALGPGFRWLIPGLEKIRKIPARSITLDLPSQRMATADGLVYDVSTSIVYRIDDPMKAMIEIDDVKSGVETALSLAAYDVVRERERDSLRQREDLDAALAEATRPRVRRWGVEIERAGFTNIAPTERTLRLTQLAALVRERAEVLGALTRGGLTHAEALVTLGSERRLISHSARRYRGASQRRGSTRMLRGRVRLTDEALAEVQDELDVLLQDDFTDRELAAQSLAKRGPVILPLLQARLLETGDRTDRLVLDRVIMLIEKAQKEKKAARASGVAGA